MIAVVLAAAALALLGPAAAGARRSAAEGVRHAPAAMQTRTGSVARARSARAPLHVPTWSYDDGCNGGVGASPGFVREWLNYASSNCGPNDDKALGDCHSGRVVYCRVIQYLDATWNIPGQDPHLPLIPSASWWLHAPNGQPIAIPSAGAFLDNQLDPYVRSFFADYVRAHFNAADGLMMDFESPSLYSALFDTDCGCRTTREIHTNARYETSHRLMARALTHVDGKPFMQIDNALAANQFLPEGTNVIDRRIGIDGVMIEGTPENFGAFDPYYANLLDQIAEVIHRTNGFVMPMSRGDAGTPYEAQSRRVQEATILLGFAPHRVVDWENLEINSTDLSVWPEEGLYPTHPVQSMRTPRGRGCMAGVGVLCSRGGHVSLQVAPGVYRRQFRRCYYLGSLFGRCAAIVNTTSSPVTVASSWLRGFHGYEITFNGGDVQSGGSLDLQGAPFQAGVTTVAPDDALLLAQ